MKAQEDECGPDILVVDDEKKIADTLALILRTKSYSVSTAYDGLQAYETCLRSSPRLVITDVVMPRMNGVELAIKIRTEIPQCSVLLFSGQAATGDILRQAHARGFDFELLAKPIHPEDLLAKVREVLKCTPLSDQ